MPAFGQTPGVGWPQPHCFSTSHWSVVLAAGHDSSPDAREALEKLCRAYWYPLYSYVRRQGRSSEDAQDLTQQFFAEFLEKNSLSRADRERGRFRTFLLTSLQNFLGHQWERSQTIKRGGGQTFVPWDEQSPEGRYQLEAATDLTPDRIFEQRWAAALFQRALGRLRDEFATAGKSAEFDELKGFLSAEPETGAYDGVAARLGWKPGTVAVATHRLRRRYGELVREEIAHTASST